MILCRLIIAVMTAATIVGAFPALAQTEPFTLTQTFNDPTPTTSDAFGYSVSVSGDNVLIGAYLDDTNDTNVGQAHLFSAATGALLRTYNDPTPTVGDNFGYSVSISGDYVLIGAYLDDTNGTNVGQAHLFGAASGLLLHTFDDPTPTVGDNFGRSVSVSGDNVLIGAWRDDTNGNDVGQAHLFSASTGLLLHTFDDPTPTTSDAFGFSVSVSENNVLIGAITDDTSGNNIGQAHLFSVATGALLRTFNDPTPTDSDQFGQSVSVSEDNVLIGSILDDTNEINAGQAHLFSASTGLLLHTFDDPTPAFNDWFGWSVSLSGDKVLIGAPWDDWNGTNVGQAHLFSATTGLLLQTFDNPTPRTYEYFGNSVSMSGDNVITGAIYDNTSGLSVGQAYLFTLVEKTGGALTGIYTAFGACVNVTTSLFVIATVNDDQVSWDCEAAGLLTNTGDTVVVIGIGMAQPVLGTVGGSLTSATAFGAICRNMTQGQQVFAPVAADGKSWNCEAAGLSVNQSDIVRVIGIGTAN